MPTRSGEAALVGRDYDAAAVARSAEPASRVISSIICGQAPSGSSWPMPGIAHQPRAGNVVGGVLAGGERDQRIGVAVDDERRHRAGAQRLAAIAVGDDREHLPRLAEQVRRALPALDHQLARALPRRTGSPDRGARATR